MVTRVCSYCQGRGWVECSQCQRDQEKKVAAEEPECGTTCSQCQGQGRCRCLGCLGTGTVELPAFA